VLPLSSTQNMALEIYFSITRTVFQSVFTYAESLHRHYCVAFHAPFATIEISITACIPSYSDAYGEVKMSGRKDSPVLPTLDQIFSEKTLSCITEAPLPNHGARFLHSASITTSPGSCSSTASDHQYTFLRSPSITFQSSISSPSASSPTLSCHKFPSCLNLPNLGSGNGSPDENDDYTKGWNTTAPAERCEEEVVVAAELPFITESQYQYYPQTAELSHVDQWKNDVEERGMKLLRRKSGLRKESSLERWWNKLRKKLGLKTNQ
jgi:hypothetical protein